jgi:C2 domain
MLFDKDFGDKISSKKKNERDPVYDETFEWEIPSTMGLNNLVLSCKVMDDDLLFDDKIGSCKIKLEELDLESEFLGVDRVVDNNWFSKDARIWLKIAYKS